jgi:hypothetical protein
MKLQLTVDTPAAIFAMVQALSGRDINDVKVVEVIKISEEQAKKAGVQPAFLRECFVNYVNSERAKETSHE